MTILSSLLCNFCCLWKILSVFNFLCLLIFGYFCIAISYAVKSLMSFESNDDAKFRIAVSTLASRLVFFKNSDAVSVGNSLASEISSRVAVVVFQLPSLMFLSSGLRYLLFCFP